MTKHAQPRLKLERAESRLSPLEISSMNKAAGSDRRSPSQRLLRAPPKSLASSGVISLVRLSRHPYSAFDFWDAEVSSEVRQVQRADRPGNYDEIDLG